MIKPITILCFSLTLLLSACCKKSLIIPTVRLEYANLDQNTEIEHKAYITADSLYFYQADMISSDTTKYQYVIELFNKNIACHIIEVNALTFENDTVIKELIHSDTITDVNYELKGFGCNERLKDLSYKHNGIKKTDATIFK